MPHLARTAEGALSALLASGAVLVARTDFRESDKLLPMPRGLSTLRLLKRVFSEAESEALISALRAHVAAGSVLREWTRSSGGSASWAAGRYPTWEWRPRAMRLAISEVIGLVRRRNGLSTGPGSRARVQMKRDPVGVGSTT